MDACDRAMIVACRAYAEASLQVQVQKAAGAESGGVVAGAGELLRWELNWAMACTSSCPCRPPHSLAQTCQLPF
jgi:hypothetical protein